MQLLAAVKLLIPFTVDNNVIPFHLETAVQVLIFWGNFFFFFSLFLFPKEKPSLVTALKWESGLLVPVPVLLKSQISMLRTCGCSTKVIYIQKICITR